MSFKEAEINIVGDSGINQNIQTGSRVAEWFKILFELIKIRITILVAFTTALGYILATKDLGLFSLYPVLGIFLLSCGAAAMNHLHERKTDKLMDRTKNRPLPRGLISASGVMIISLLFLAAGSSILFFKSTLLTLAIGLITFFWYNAFYTPLKKVYSLAIIPGSLVGALPPVAGWVAAGGQLFDPVILIIASFFFIWQIPHFWILLLAYGNDYSKGGFPTLTSILSKEQLKNITFYWMLVTIAVAVSFNFFGILNYGISYFLLFALCFWMFYNSICFLKSNAIGVELKNMFIRINIFSLLIITLLSIDKLIKLF